jgi:cell filamentation protein
MVDKYGTGEDPYTYHDSDVLINKFGIRDPHILEEAEKEFTELAALSISFKEPPYNFETLCDIHRTLFSDLFEWAGEIRFIDISKGSTRFCHYKFIKRESDKLFKSLAQENFLEDLEKELFIKKLAEYYCDINVLHPFREGNGRAQRVLFEHICINSGYNLNLSGVSVKEWVDANIFGYRCDYSSMEKIFARCVSTIKQ